LRTAGIRSWYVGSDRSLAEHMSVVRWARLTQGLPDFENMRVLDLSGPTVFSEGSPIGPSSVTVINLNAPDDGLAWVRPVQGDACDAPELVGEHEFDLFLTNSLIEHHGGNAKRLGFAEVVRSLARNGPCRRLPVLPGRAHRVFHGMQFLPLDARHWLAPRLPLGDNSRLGRRRTGRERDPYRPTPTLIAGPRRKFR
jgi:hypothetical protein